MALGALTAGLCFGVKLRVTMHRVPHHTAHRGRRVVVSFFAFGFWLLVSVSSFEISSVRFSFLPFTPVGGRRLVLFLLLQLYTPHAPRPRNKANLCCTALQVAGCEPHMPGQNPFYPLNLRCVCSMLHNTPHAGSGIFIAKKTI